MPKSPSLPSEYLKWLDELGPNPSVIADDLEWELADQTELAKSLKISGQKITYLEQTQVYAQMLAQVTGETATIDEDENPVEFARIEQWLTIGFDNEDLLCVDPHDGFSVWCFHPSEGGDVERVAESLTQWMESAEAVGEDLDDEEEDEDVEADDEEADDEE